MTTLGDIAKLSSAKNAGEKPSGLFEQLQRLIAEKGAKAKINQTTTGLLLTKRAKRTVHSYVNETLFLEQETERLDAVLLRIRRESQWLNTACVLHILHVHCKHCKRTFTSPSDLLLRQDHRSNGSARYLPLHSLEGFSALPLQELHRQERIAICHECVRGQVQRHAIEHISINGQLQFKF